MNAYNANPKPFLVALKPIIDNYCSNIIKEHAKKTLPKLKVKEILL